jgi:hypothetical protein
MRKGLVLGIEKHLSLRCHNQDRSGHARYVGVFMKWRTKLVDRLLHKDLLSRTEAAEDRRFQDVKLTAAGRALVPKLAALADQNDEEFFSHLSSKEREALVATLKKLVAIHKLKKLPTT